jgi:dihydrolipoamide dehydrogenase
MELGSVYARLGTKVEVVEFLDRIIPGMDKDAAKELMKSMKKMGVKFHMSYAVSEVTTDGKSATLKAKHRTKDTELEIKADYCLVSIGRRAYTDNLGLENIGVQTDERGRIEVNAHLETAVKGVYAIGDVIKGAMLAHKAEEEGVLVAEIIAGQKPHINYNLIPGVVYTWPEVAGVGALEEDLKADGIPFNTGKFPMRALGRARASMDIEGFVKILSHKETDEVLGVHMIGPRVADIIAEAVIAMEFRASAEDIARASHAHPTYTEAMKEAALAATENRALHI